jgi:hypothetical protein
MICAFLGSVVPAMDAEAPSSLPEDGFFDLIPASQLYLRKATLRADGRPPPHAERRDAK